MEINWTTTNKMLCNRCGKEKLHCVGYVGKWKEEKVFECIGCGEMTFKKCKKEAKNVSPEVLSEVSHDNRDEALG